ncbi:MAG: hypothetical protein WB919_06695 [Candidatus Sulfotelmatobacter sp.]
MNKKTGKKRAKKRAAKKKTTQKKARPKKSSRKKANLKKKVIKKTAAANKRKTLKKPVQRASRTVDQIYPDSRRARALSGEQSGDLQGLSRAEGADSESVDELLEEGNAFEADAVLGVENADRAEGEEVHTHEVPEDDVPKEYLDED